MDAMAGRTESNVRVIVPQAQIPTSSSSPSSLRSIQLGDYVVVQVDCHSFSCYWYFPVAYQGFEAPTLSSKLGAVGCEGLKLEGLRAGWGFENGQQATSAFARSLR